MPPFPELRVQLHIHQCAGDRTVAEALLYLEKVRACLIVMKGRGMAERMECIAAAFPAQLGQPVLKDPGNGGLIDVRTGLLAREEPVIRSCGRAAFFPVLVKDLFETYREFGIAGITALAHFFGDRDRAVGKRNVTESQRCDLAQAERCPIGGSQFGLMLEVLCPEDKRHDILFRRDFGEWMVYLAQGKVVIRERSAQDEAEIFLYCTVIDIDGTWRVTESALFFGALQVEEECAELCNVCLINRNVIGIPEPYAAFKDRLQITVDRAWPVIDQFQDIRDALQFGSVES